MELALLQVRNGRSRGSVEMLQHNAPDYLFPFLALPICLVYFYLFCLHSSAKQGIQLKTFLSIENYTFLLYLLYSFTMPSFSRVLILYIPKP